MNCIIRGGANRTFNAAAEPQGTIISNSLINTQQTTITCTEVAAGSGYTVGTANIVETIPRSEEI
jgi:hypothetical protein